jgi:hypothetical protein
MLQRFLSDRKVFWLFFVFDEDLANKAQAAGCPLCGGPLHQAHYQRKPRGWSFGPDEDLDRRFSFCCYLCRRRLTPSSFRFLGRKVYVGGVLVLVSALLGDASARRCRRLHDLCGVDARTLARWRSWWANVFSQTEVWQGLSIGVLLDGTPSIPIPLRLLRGVRLPSLAGTLTRVLQLLLPLSGGGSG